MKKIIYFFTMTWMPIFLLNTSAYGMELIDHATENTEQYSSCSLIQLFDENLIEIFSYCHAHDIDPYETLKNSIKNFTKIRIVCKRFSDLLTIQVMGSFCKHYTDIDKKYTVSDITKALVDLDNMHCVPLPLLILAYAQADIRELFEQAVEKNNIPFVTELLKHHVDPNAIKGGFPIFFNAKSVAMAHLLINYGARIQETFFGYNVLCWIVNVDEYPSELVQLYLARNVDAKILDPEDNSCLLHELARQPFNHPSNSTIVHFFKKAELLLNAIPDMIDTLNKYEKTPIDTAIAYGASSTQPDIFNRLIELYRKQKELIAQAKQITDKSEQ
jgi:ankyrin repeat protein